jgi:hypothetical protein
MLLFIFIIKLLSPEYKPISRFTLSVTYSRDGGRCRSEVTEDMHVYRIGGIKFIYESTVTRIKQKISHL